MFNTPSTVRFVELATNVDERARRSVTRQIDRVKRVRYRSIRDALRKQRVDVVPLVSPTEFVERLKERYPPRRRWRPIPSWSLIEPNPADPAWLRIELRVSRHVESTGMGQQLHGDLSATPEARFEGVIGLQGLSWMVLVWAILLLVAVVPVGALCVMRFGVVSLGYAAPVLALCGLVGVLGLGYFAAEPSELTSRALRDLEYAAANDVQVSWADRS